MLNRVEIIGRLTENPRCGGNPPNNYCFITVAVNNQYKNKDTGEKKVKSEFIPVSLFGNIATHVGKYCGKGTKVFIEGSLVVRSIKNNGVRLEKMELHGKNVIFLDKLPERDDLPMED